MPALLRSPGISEAMWKLQELVGHGRKPNFSSGHLGWTVSGLVFITLLVGRRPMATGWKPAPRIGKGIHYRALHLHQYYRETFGYECGDFPSSEWISGP